MLIISEVPIINLYEVSNFGKVCIAKSDTLGVFRFLGKSRRD